MIAPRPRRPRRGPTARAALGVVAAALLLTVVGCGGSSDDESGGASATVTADEDWIAHTDDDAVFTVDCPFSHRAPDDPIVHPGRPGASHSHEFFGSTETDASSTGESLQGTPTTCEDPDDTAAYWVPTLSVRGVPVDPVFVRAYYRARRGVDVREVEPPPLGLALLSGDPAAADGDDHTHATGDAAAESEGHDHGTDAAESEGHDHATSDTASDGHAHDHSGTEADPEGSTDPDSTVDDIRTAVATGGGWGCGLRPKRLHAEPPTDCTETSPLALQLRFPDCWDGEDLDSADHRSHMARSVDGACPTTHPVLITEVQVTITWPITGADGADVSIASGDLTGAHGDFLNGWDPEALARHVELCVWAKANCTVG